MRKGLLLTKRDLEILDFLSLGPATQRRIFKFFFDNGKNIQTRGRLQLRRMSKLEAAGFVRTMSCPSIADTVYVLTSNAAPVISEQNGMDAAFVWCDFHTRTLDHDLRVAECARKLDKQHLGKRDYRVSSIEGEWGLKKGIRLKKGEYLPDFTFTIKTPLERSIALALEVDNGTISKKDFLGKVRYFEGHPTLFVVSTQQRLDRLLRYLKDERIRHLVYLITYDNFLAKPLFHLLWQTNRFDGPIALNI